MTTTEGVQAMPVFDSYPAGTPCWIDLMTPDVDGSASFYSSVFGWDAHDQFDDDGTRIYTTFKQGDHDVAGMGGQAPGMEGMPAVWNSYIAVDDVNAAAEAVSAAGGTVMMPPMEVMTAGHMAVFADPTGPPSPSGRPATTRAPVSPMSRTPGRGTS